ncbi:hypothetical protein BAZSYMB_GCONTIG00864_0 [Bathymodiolus azoricus thioautotrophic gill symbiont]|uniref:Uncharacterized protein n=1 Tax=Bathymodiolus azoricus thioautotrophic gill symbiont TaxID=235205 RepID=A0A1H6JTZ6_9GAMM|nr:hypothetical protein BAZSYMB_GCONTIG00864_0 [Bathymodiolus azoricus thioautotrophic gill symbiont]
MVIARLKVILVLARVQQITSKRLLMVSHFTRCRCLSWMFMLTRIFLG